ncbi:MAG: amidohydrolase family protein [Longicatena sp.]
MEQKATLLIKNIEKIYTNEQVQGKSLVLTCAFIAIHHDIILTCSCGDFSSYVDKDTRILDARNHIAIPSFIEPDATLSRSLRSTLAKNEFYMNYMHTGTLSIHVRHGNINKLLHKNYHYEILEKREEDETIPIVYALATMKLEKGSIPKSFCISCQDAHVSMQNQMLAAQMLALKEEISALTLLEALTLNPAKRLGLKQQGVLKKGYIANILVLSVCDIHTFFYSMNQHQISQIIHKGVRIYPNLLV